jgi:hypothetical protein
MPFFVQFPHPGSEHTPKPATVDTVMDWNVGDHKRKFLRADGAYVEDGQYREGAYGFWGEWEAPSRVVEVWPKGDALPRFLHEPLYRPPNAGSYQNTDPLVFGDRFLYTNCKQLGNAKLRKLTPGSLVLFGSGTGAGFVLDTVFVVADAPARPYELGETAVLPDNPTAGAVVFQPLTTTKDVGRECVAYSGRMHDHGADLPYSFVPGRPADGEVRFARPLLKPDGALADLVEPKLYMGARVLERSKEQLMAAWQQVLDICAGHGLAQGVHATPPAISPTALPSGARHESPPESATRRGC